MWTSRSTTQNFFRALPRPKGQRHRKGGNMNIDEFFDMLRKQKWVLYIPERVYRAHWVGLLRGWGISGYKQLRGIKRMEPILDLLQSQGADLKIPFVKSEKPDWKEEKVLEKFADHLILHTGAEDCPSFPVPVVISDSFWDSLMLKLNLTESLTNRILAWNDWAYSVRFCPIWVTAIESSLGSWPPFGISVVEKKEWHKKAREVQEKRRHLREEYGLTGEYFGKNNTRKANLVVLKKVYPPEQVRHVRRQLEDRIRKDPAEVIRYALARGLVE